MCPKHKVSLIKACPDCGKRFRWNLVSAYKCRCEFDLRESKTQTVSCNSLIVLLRILRDRLYRQKYAVWQAEKIGFPVFHLYKMKLNNLLGIIYRLMKLVKPYRQVNGQKLDNDIDRLSCIANALTNWPHNFRYFIFDLIKERDSQLDERVFKKSELLFKTFLDSTIPIGEIEFMNEGFTGIHKLLFEKDYMDGSFIERCKKNNTPHKYYGTIKEVSKKLRIHPSMVRNLIQTKQLDVRVYDKGKRRIKLYVVTNETRRRVPGKSFSAREVAKDIYLPEPIVVKFKELGLFPNKYIGDKLTSYHEEDVKFFKKKMRRAISDLKRVRSTPDGYSSLRRIFKKQSLNILQKSLILQAVMLGVFNDRDSPIFGRLYILHHGRVLDILLPMKQVQDFLDSHSLTPQNEPLKQNIHY